MTVASGPGPPSPAPRVVEVPQRRRLWQGPARGPAMPHARPVDRLARPAPQAARGAGDRASVTLALFESTLRLASLTWSASTVSLMGRTPMRWISLHALVPPQLNPPPSPVHTALT